MATTSVSRTTLLSRYMAEVGRHPVLDADEEQRLARRWRDEGDVEAARTLVTANLRFVVKVARDYAGYGLRLLDLIQEGNVGLMHAVRRFDPERGFRLISYASYWIRAYIHAYIMSQWRMVKLGTTQAQRKLFFKLAQTKREMGADRVYEEPGEAKRIAARLDVDASSVREMDVRMGAADVSLDAVNDVDGRSMLQTMASATPDPETEFGDIEARALVHARLETALEALPEREREVIQARFLADEPETLRDLGARMGISGERIRQLEARARKKLRAALADIDPEAITESMSAPDVGGLQAMRAAA